MNKRNARFLDTKGAEMDKVFCWHCGEWHVPPGEHDEQFGHNCDADVAARFEKVWLAAIAAMQGIIAHDKLGLLDTEAISQGAVGHARALVAEIERGEK